MIGMGSIITKKKNIFPGCIFYGKPVKKTKLNKIALKRYKISNKGLKKDNKI